MANPVLEHIHINRTGITYDLRDIYAERAENRVFQFQDNPDNSHYPSERLVYNSIYAITAKVTSVLPLAEDAYPNALYILQKDSGCVLYKVVDGAWQKLGGSNALVFDELPKDEQNHFKGDSSFDYYIKSELDNVYLHYRWMDAYTIDNEGTPQNIPAHFYLVGGDTYSKQQIDASLDAKEDVSNRVSLFQNTPDNQHYPTEKLVYDSLALLQDTLEDEIDDGKPSVLETLPATGDANKDYYVKTRKENVYAHYRWADTYTIPAENAGEEDTVVPGHFYSVGSTNSANVVTELPSVANADADADYILKSNGAVLHYRVIDNEWKMIGGASSTVGTDLPASGNAFTDYYIETSISGVYQHYRWLDSTQSGVEGHFYKIGMDAEGDKGRISALESKVNSFEGEFNTIDAKFDNLGNMVSNVAAPQDGSGGIVVTYKDGSVSNVNTYDVRKRVEEVNRITSGLRVLYTDGTAEDIEIQGGGGSSEVGTATITRVTNADATCVYGEDFNIEYKFEATDSAGDRVGAGSAVWYVKGIRVATSTALQVDTNGVPTTNSFNIGQYLQAGSNQVRLEVSVSTGSDEITVRRKEWTVTAIEMYLEWNYDETTINTSDQVTIRFTPYGDVSKTTYIIIDNDEEHPITNVTDRSGAPQSVTINRLSHGSHHVKMYCEATVNGTKITSDTIEHDMIFVWANNDTPVIACPVAAGRVMQYDTIALPLVIYTPNSMTSDALLYVDDVLIAEWTNVDRSVQEWYYTPSEDGTRLLKVVVGSVTKYIIINVDKLNIDNAEIEGYTFRLKASDFAGNDALRAWQSNGVTATFSDNFDWNNGGIKSEYDGEGGVGGNLRQYIEIKAGTRLTINSNIFADDSTVNGKTVKIIFKVKNCRDYDAIAASCFANNIGFRLSAHEAIIKSSGSSISVPYAEDDYIELEFDIYPAPTTTNPNNFRYLMAWLDGVITTCRVYGESDNFTQINPSGIVIGSDDCDVSLYMVKVYPMLMSLDNHIENFIADAPNAQEMVERYDRNNILDNAKKNIDYSKLAEANPECRVWLYDIPYMTIGKKDKVKNCSFTQILQSGSSKYQLTGTGTLTVQGTSSVDYLKGAANTDINFTSLSDDDNTNLMANGVVGEDDDVKYGKNYYVGNTETGEVTVFDVTEANYDENGVLKLTPDCIPVERDASRNVTKYVKALGYKINDDSTPITYSNMKVNFASCEQVNNMCNAAWYQRFQPYQSLTPRDCMEFAMGVQFIRDTDYAANSQDGHFVLFGDNAFHLYSIGNLGTSKKNVHVFHDLSNPKECCIEVGNNLQSLCRMTTDDMSDSIWFGGSNKAFEMRYPDTDTPSSEITDGWQRFISWMARCNPNAATNEPLSSPATFGIYTFKGHDRGGTQVLRGTRVTQYAGTYVRDTFEYRMAKMLSECEDYLVMDSVVYHFVYIERHTMCDNVAKNTFWSSSDLLHWDLSKAYDMDTSDGNNNEGKMTFDYGNEANDVIGTKTVFNANDAVWFVFVSNLYEACQTMFQNREAEGAWSSSAYHQFLLKEQRKIPERVWVQCYWYDYLRTYEQGLSTEWILFLDGGQKTHQRMHYEYYEEMYDSSKYVGSSATSDNINFRGYYPTEAWDAASAANWANLEPKAEIGLTMYNKCYVNVKVDSTSYRQKAERGVSCVIDFSDNDTLNDTVINIYSAKMIQKIADMSRLYPGTINMSAARKIRSLTIGSSDAGYSNTNCDSISLEHNTMLEELNVQNLPAVNGTLSLTACAALKRLDARGSSFTGYDFAVGGVLEQAYINAPVSLSMRDLYYLTDSNFSVASYDRLESLRIENCPSINSLAIVNSATNLNRVRLIDVLWTVSATDVLNRLLRMLGTDEEGFVTPVSVLTGEATVTGSIRNSELTSYEEAWGNLMHVIYDPSKLTPQYTVTYKNTDESVLYTTLVDIGNRPPDPVVNKYIPVPTREPDDQYTYTYSGWTDLDQPVTENTTIYATYTSSLNMYTVSWYTMNGDATPLQTGQYLYGAYAVYTGDLPTYTSEESSGQYYVFTGWDKSTGVVKGNMNVYAVWEVAAYPAASKELKDMTCAEMSAVSKLRMTESRYAIKDYFDLEMGHDFNFSNVESAELLKNKFFGGDEYYDTNIKLFAENNQSFTLAIDYEYLATSNTRGVLAGCFDVETNGGFALRFINNTSSPSDSYSVIDWMNGDLRRVGKSVQRNIIVLRYIEGSNNLIIYSFNGAPTSSSINVYNDDITVVRANGTMNPVVDATLCFGAVRYTENNVVNIANRATGWIYWAKIWYDDLGDDVCRKLASWPHETVRMEYTGGERQKLSTSNITRAYSSFFANNPLPLLYQYSASGYNTKTWEGSRIQEFCRERILKGLAYKWQSIIKPVKVLTAPGALSYRPETSVEKIYLPAYVEVYSTSDAQYITETDMDDTRYVLSDLFSTTHSCARWCGLIISDRDNSAGTRVISQAQDPTYTGSYGDIREGDIWYRTSNQPRYYVYVPKATYSKHSMIGCRTFYSGADQTNVILAYDEGYWVRASDWWTRSPDASNNGYFRYFYNYYGYFTYASYTAANGILIGLSI